MDKKEINQSIVNSSFGDIQGDIRIGIDAKDVEIIMRRLLIENRLEIESLLKQYHIAKIDIEGNNNITMQNINNSTVTVNQLDNKVLHSIVELQQQLISQNNTNKYIRKLPHRPVWFIGRTTKLIEIHNKITATDLRKNIYLVNGIGGMGKTTIIQEYLYQSACLAHFRNIIYIPAHNDRINAILLETDLENAFFYGIAQALDLNLKEYAHAEDKRKIVFHHLKNLEGNTLIVIDNANNKDQLVDLQPYFREIATNANCKFLITTRTNPDEYNETVIEIIELELSEAVELFKHYYRQDIENQEYLEKLLNHISLHTLLTELLAKVGEKKGYLIEDLFQLILKQDRLMKAFSQQELQRKIVVGEHADATQRMKVATIHQYIYSLFEPELLIEESQQSMVRFFSVLPSDDIPIEHLKILLRVTKEKECDFQEDLDFLQQWGWLTGKYLKNRQRQMQNLAYKMHPLVQDVVYEKLLPNINNCEPIVITISEMLAKKDAQSFVFQPYAKTVIDKLNLLNNRKE